MAIREPQKYVVLKAEDVQLAARRFRAFQATWNTILSMLDAARALKGKKPHKQNHYIVVNQDESYAEEVWELIVQRESEKEAAQKA